MPKQLKTQIVLYNDMRLPENIRRSIEFSAGNVFSDGSAYHSIERRAKPIEKCMSCYFQLKTTSCRRTCIFSWRHACRIIERYTFSERHAKPAENACRSIERHTKPAENACRSIERYTKQLMQIIWECIAFYGTAFKTSWKRMSFCRTTCRISWECTSCWGRHVERCAFSAEI